MRFRGVKVILRDGLEVTDQLRKDMFLAWQDLQLLHATQPGPQYKYKVGGNKSWKVSSLNGVDRIELLGYPPEKKQEKRRPKIRQRDQVLIWPAFEVYTRNWGRGDYKGIVICRGGGFEPPYEFIPKELFPKEVLPYDEPDQSAGPLPEERNWLGISKRKDVIRLRYEDLEPIGIAEATDCWASGLPYTSGTTFSSPEIRSQACTYYEELVTNSEMCVAEGYPAEWTEKHYNAIARAYQSWTSIATRSDQKVMSYRIEGDPDWEYWDSYTYYYTKDSSGTFNPGTKPTARILNTPTNWYHHESGSGSGEVPITQETGRKYNFASDAPWPDTIYWFVYCTYDNGYTQQDTEDWVVSLVEDNIAAGAGYSNSEYPRMQLGVSNYSSTTEIVDVYFFGWDTAVYDNDTFAFLVQENISTRVLTYNDTGYYPLLAEECPGDHSYQGGPAESDLQTTSAYSDYVFVLNQDRMVVDVGSASMTYTQVDTEDIKLFKNGDRYDAMGSFYVYESDSSWNLIRECFGFSHIMQAGENPAILTTTLFNSFGFDYQPLPDITDDDGNALYPYFYRLIRETVTIIEEYI
jgi:hypothetical protein